MAVTPFDKNNYSFSLRVHKQFAVSVIYPLMFPGCDIDPQHQDGNKADLEDKVDVILKVTRPDQKSHMEFKVQERWRKPEYQDWQDITLTAWNNASGKAVEFYQGKFDFLLYGYFDEATWEFKDVILIDFSALRYKYLTGEIKAKPIRVNEKDQSFIPFGFRDLILSNCVIWASSSITDKYPVFTSNRTDLAAIDYWRGLYLSKINIA